MHKLEREHPGSIQGASRAHWPLISVATDSLECDENVRVFRVEVCIDCNGSN